MRPLPDTPRSPRVSLALAAAAVVGVLAAPAHAQLDVVPEELDVPLQVGGPAATAVPRAQGDALVGVWRLAEGVCGGEGVSQGSYFRMVTPAGQVGSGPYAFNSSSPCGDNSFTPLTPGSDGGLVTGGYQPTPDPAFSDGHATAQRIIEPTPFNGVRFSASTNPEDPQTGTATVTPSVSASGTSLSGDLRAFSAHWNGQHFNQGAPKPDGSSPGNTEAVSGTYDPATGAFTLEWASQIQGGPFNNFTGFWHLEGTFQPSNSGSGGGSGGGSGTSSTTPGGSSTTGAGTSGSGPSSVAGADQRQVAAGSGPTPRTGGPLGVVVPATMLFLALGGQRLARGAKAAGS